MIDCFKKTFKSDGIAKGLYAGTVPALAANVAENSVLFAGYGFCQKLIMNVTNVEVSIYIVVILHKVIKVLFILL